MKVVEGKLCTDSVQSQTNGWLRADFACSRAREGSENWHDVRSLPVAQAMNAKNRKAEKVRILSRLGYVVPGAGIEPARLAAGILSLATYPWRTWIVARFWRNHGDCATLLQISFAPTNSDASRLVSCARLLGNLPAMLELRARKKLQALLDEEGR